MHLFLVITTLLMPSAPKADAGLPPLYDTAGIYKTIDDFVHERVSLSSPYQVKIKQVPFWVRLPLNIDSNDVAYLRQPDGKEEKIQPDAAFGFVTRGIKYMYIPRQKKYLAVLNEKAPVYFFIKEKYISGLKMDSVDDSLLYTRNLGAPLKALTDANIQQDFADNKELANRLYLLRLAVIKKGFDGEVHRRAFLKYRQLVQQYLAL